MEDLNKIVEKVEKYKTVTNRLLQHMRKIEEVIRQAMITIDILRFEVPGTGIVVAQGYDGYPVFRVYKHDELIDKGYIPYDVKHVGGEGYWGGNFNRPFTYLGREGIFTVARNIRKTLETLLIIVDKSEKTAEELAEKLEAIAKVL